MSNSVEKKYLSVVPGVGYRRDLQMQGQYYTAVPQEEGISNHPSIMQNYIIMTKTQREAQQQRQENLRLIHQQFKLLLHAYKCLIRERHGDSDAWKCFLPYCKTMKYLLAHMTTCKENKMCKRPYCSLSRQIIAHCKHCRKFDCLFCSSSVEMYKDEVANSLDDVVANRPITSYMHAPVTTLTSHFEDISLDMNRLRRLNDSDLFYIFNGNHFFNRQLPSNFQLSRIIVPPVQETKKLHQSITPDIKNHLVDELSQKIFPTIYNVLVELEAKRQYKEIVLEQLQRQQQTQIEKLQVELHQVQMELKKLQLSAQDQQQMQLPDQDQQQRVRLNSSKQIIAHWEECRTIDCPICLPSKQADENKAANSRPASVANQPSSQSDSSPILSGM